jgi:hypothetical protein
MNKNVVMGMKPRTIVLARPSRNLLDWTGVERVVSCNASSQYLAITVNDGITNRRLYVCCSCSDLQSVQISETVIVICSYEL